MNKKVGKMSGGGQREGVGAHSLAVPFVAFLETPATQASCFAVFLI